MATPIIEFQEVELPRLMTDMATGGETFQTAIIGNRFNIHQRNVGRVNAVRKWTVDFAGLAHHTAEQELMRSFFNSKYGMAIGFRFFPPSDNRFLMDDIGTGNGLNVEFPLYRKYYDGLTTISRRIVKPSNDDVDIYFGAVLQSFVRGVDYTIDTVNGKITFAVAPGGGVHVILDGGEFCVPAVFDVDSYNGQDYTTFTEWNGVGIVELLPANLGIT